MFKIFRLILSQTSLIIALTISLLISFGAVYNLFHTNNSFQRELAVKSSEMVVLNKQIEELKEKNNQLNYFVSELLHKVKETENKLENISKEEKAPSHEENSFDKAFNTTTGTTFGAAFANTVLSISAGIMATIIPFILSIWI